MLFCAGPQMKAMMLLGLNCGLGNEDLAQLKTGHIKGGMARFSPAEDRSGAALSPLAGNAGSVAAVIRPDDEVVFRTKYGNSWGSKGTKSSNSPISFAFRHFCKGMGVYKPGRGFYSLRHIAQTIGEESQDRAAVDFILVMFPWQTIWGRSIGSDIGGRKALSRCKAHTQVAWAEGHARCTDYALALRR